MSATLGAWLRSARARQAAADEHISALHALVGKVLSRPAAWQIAHPDLILTTAQTKSLDDLLARLLDGEPLAYITGVQAFYGRDFHVSPAVLIPRPETELVVELAIDAAGSFSQPIRIADVGTGSGCIAVTLAKDIGNAQVTASDISFDALQLASCNSESHQVSQEVQLIQTNLMDGVEARFDIICANLPYIPHRTLEGLDVVRYEPRSALDGGPDGLRLIQPLLEDLTLIRKPRCTALFEIEETQGETFRTLSHDLYPQATITIENDLAGKERVGVIRFTS